jgi:hypothetical protein
MRIASLVTVAAALVLLAACTPPAQQSRDAPPAAETTEMFNDNGCLGYLLLQRAAMGENRASGDVAPLEAATAAWRASARHTLTADELAQYEASSFAVQDDETAEHIAARAAACVADAPR